MIGQRAEVLKSRADIYPYGCYMMSLIMLAWEFMDGSEIITPEQIIEFHDWARYDGDCMEKHCYITNPQIMVDYWCPDRLQFKGKESYDYLVTEDYRAIQLWTLKRENGGVWKHFCYGNNARIGGYDPWVRSLTKSQGSVDSIRLFEVI
jgi:hypothetical protein